jgi:hypothetical protein
MKKEKEKKNDRQTNDSHVATRVKYGDATFLSWFKSICNPANGHLENLEGLQTTASFCFFKRFENWEDPEQSRPFE